MLYCSKKRKRFESNIKRRLTEMNEFEKETWLENKESFNYEDEMENAEEVFCCDECQYYSVNPQ
jgi:hypothetical protein